MKKERAKVAAPEARPYDYDVFISYSSKDKAWVRGELLKRIEEAGIRAFIDFRDFTRGAPSISEMERGVSICRKTLLILTPDYIKSGWAEIESIMLASLDPANRDLRTLPLLKKRCDGPRRIAALTHIDFTDRKNLDLAWRQVLTALGKPPEPPQTVQPLREKWNLTHPYAMPPNFTGRVTERKMLTDWMSRDTAHPLLVLRALGGFGKSALTWHWLLHDVDPAQWPRVVWWSFYEGDASFESFVANTLKYLSRGQLDMVSASPRDQLLSLLQKLHSDGTILILDGFERALRAFGGLNAVYQGDEIVDTEGGERDCLSPLADTFVRHVANLPEMRGKVLLTTRLRPSAVETRGGILLQGCREEGLVQLQPADAVEFFHAQGIRGGRAEIEVACEPYGYHPLSLRLLAGLIVGDFQQPGDIAAAQRLDVSGDLVQRRHHVLEQAYMSLGPERQKLLSRIACFRSPVSYDALRALADTGSPDSYALIAKGENLGGSLDGDIRDLIARGLLHRDLKMNRFDLHPIVRRYAYDRLGVTDRTGAHARLRDYFAAVPEPENVHSLYDLAPVIELYHHTVRAGQYDEACDLFFERLDKTTYQLGASQLRIDLLRGLFPDRGIDNPRLKDESDRAWTLNALATTYSVSGQPGRAIAALRVVIEIAENLRAMNNVAIALGNLASGAQIQVGSLRAAYGNLGRSIGLCRKIKDKFWQAVGHRELGLLLAYCGAWAQSSWNLMKAHEMFEEQNAVQSQGVVLNYRILLGLLRQRTMEGENVLRTEIADFEPPVVTARRALALVDETAQGRYAIERDYVRTHWLLGAAYRVAGEMDEAESHLNESLERCRRINNVESEANILIDLARLRMATAAPNDALRLAEEALLIADRCGYVLQGADAHLVLAKLAKDRGDVKELHAHATEALRLATCDGPPDYTYKAAYDEATALLR
jgi:tetratricopeptide (TPR) repeat protein